MHPKVVWASKMQPFTSSIASGEPARRTPWVKRNKNTTRVANNIGKLIAAEIMLYATKAYSMSNMQEAFRKHSGSIEMVRWSKCWLCLLILWGGCGGCHQWLESQKFKCSRFIYLSGKCCSAKARIVGGKDEGTAAASKAAAICLGTLPQFGHQRTETWVSRWRNRLLPTIQNYPKGRFDHPNSAGRIWQIDVGLGAQTTPKVCDLDSFETTTLCEFTGGDNMLSKERNVLANGTCVHWSGMFQASGSSAGCACV